MSTRGYLGRLNLDGTITFIYSHANNYPSANGWLLATHYTDPAKVDALMALQAVSEVGLEIGDVHEFCFDLPRTDGYLAWCRSFYRDRGETISMAQTVTPEQWVSHLDTDIESVFLFDGAGWLYAPVKGSGRFARFGAWSRLVITDDQVERIAITDGTEYMPPIRSAA